jgi:hypothetical protein
LQNCAKATSAGIASDRLNVHDSSMADEDFKNLEHTVERHHGEFVLMVERIEELENDLKIVVRYSGLQHAIIDAASGADLVETKKLRDKYGIRIW